MRRFSGGTCSPASSCFHQCWPTGRWFDQTWCLVNTLESFISVATSEATLGRRIQRSSEIPYSHFPVTTRLTNSASAMLKAHPLIKSPHCVLRQHCQTASPDCIPRLHPQTAAPDCIPDIIPGLRPRTAFPDRVPCASAGGLLRGAERHARL